MPVDYRIFGHEHLFIARFHGLYSTDDGRHVTRQYLADPAFHPGQAHLMLLSDVSEFQAGFTDLVNLVRWKARQFQAIPPGTPCVMVAPTDTAFGMARIYEQLGDTLLPLRISVVRTLEQAPPLLESDDGALGASIGDMDFAQLVNAV